MNLRYRIQSDKDASRSEHQLERGKRYGNRRKEIARLKVKERKKQRRIDKTLTVRAFPDTLEE